MREKRAGRIRQSRWLWIRLVWQGEKTLEAGGFVFFVGGDASWNMFDRQRYVLSKEHCDIMALETWSSIGGFGFGRRRSSIRDKSRCL